MRWEKNGSEKPLWVTGNLYNIFPILMPLIMNVMSLLFCFIQAMIFTMLLGIYTAEAAEEE